MYAFPESMEGGERIYINVFVLVLLFVSKAQILCLALSLILPGIQCFFVCLFPLLTQEPWVNRAPQTILRYSKIMEPYAVS